MVPLALPPAATAAAPLAAPLPVLLPLALAPVAPLLAAAAAMVAFLADAGALGRAWYPFVPCGLVLLAAFDPLTTRLTAPLAAALTARLTALPAVALTAPLTMPLAVAFTAPLTGLGRAPAVALLAAGAFEGGAGCLLPDRVRGLPACALEFGDGACACACADWPAAEGGGALGAVLFADLVACCLSAGLGIGWPEGLLPAGLPDAGEAEGAACGALAGEGVDRKGQPMERTEA